MLKKHFADEETFYIDLLDPEMEKRYSARPMQLIHDWQAKAKKQTNCTWIVIDEVQRIPKILDVVHLGIETHKIKFALTGSSARKIKRGNANLLAGRASEFKLHPFSYLELKDAFDLNFSLAYGTLPTAIELKDEPTELRRFLNAYVNTYLREEIQAEQVVRNMEPFRLFLEVAAAASGKILNVSKLSRQCGIDPKSGQRYFEILSDTLIGFYLPAYFLSIRKQQAQHPKFYFFDTGVMHAATGILGDQISAGTYQYGNVFEHFVILECWRLNDATEAGYKMSYFRSADDAEIDLILSKGQNKTILIEIKSSKSPDPVETTKLAKLATSFPNSESYILCQTEMASIEKGIHILPWQEGLETIFGIKNTDA